MSSISIKREGETLQVPEGCFALIMPTERAHPACVALQPIQAGETSSTATQTTRKALLTAFARADGVKR